MATHPKAARQKPFLDLRIGGLRLTVQRLPYPVLVLMTGLAGSFGSLLWWGR